MDLLNKTLFTNSEDDLKKIYDEEFKKLSKNELVLECLSNLRMEDLKTNISEESKQRIEKALLTVEISDYLEFGSGLTLLGLDDFKLSNINLSYSEQKLIKEKVQELVNNEIKRRQSHATESLEKKIEQEKSKFMQLEKENRELMLKLEESKLEAFELMQQVADVFIGSDQKEIVKSLTNDMEILDLKAKRLIQAMELHESKKTKYSHKVFQEISSELDELIKKRNNQ